MFTFVTVTLLLATAVRGVTIKFPVLVNPPAGWFAVSPSWGLCKSTTEGAHGLMVSNRDCVINKLADSYQYTREDAEQLLRYGTQEAGAKPPLAQGEATIADENSKKALCKAAHDCICKISLDWCKKGE